MKITIKNARVVDTKSIYHNEVVDLYIEDGKIVQIDKSISKKSDQVIERENLHISPGWMDIGAMCWEPGMEYREDIRSLKQAAAKGGYTKVFVWPNTNPVIDNKAQYEYFRNQNHNHAVDLLPICSMTKNAAGKELAEILDLCNLGATLFSDGLLYKGDKSELYKVLEYLKPTEAKLLYAPNAFKIFPDGQIHESKTSIFAWPSGVCQSSVKSWTFNPYFVLQNMPDYQCVIHNISSKKTLNICANPSVAAVGVSYLNLCKEVGDCEGFETNYKVIPPLRSVEDRIALQKGVASDKITYISSNHFPIENDLKDKEFGTAHFGASGIETVFAALQTDTKIELSKLVEKLTYGPAQAAGIHLHSINENTKTNLTLFDPNLKWNYNDSVRKSKCINNPYYNSDLVGKAIAILNGTHLEMLD